MSDKAQKNISRILTRRKRSVKRLIILGILLLVICIYSFGDYGLYQYYQLNREEKRLQTELAQLELESKQLEMERQLLQKQDPDYLERIAREKFGLVKPGEKIYKLTPIPLSGKDY
ncbi:hypothetical protein AMJ80_00160 [bacterium SM23_31]|nr:MAG: hypothetical protein AMJ80_00160 [bacterium SM23_31]